MKKKPSPVKVDLQDERGQLTTEANNNEHGIRAHLCNLSTGVAKMNAISEDSQGTCPTRKRGTQDIIIGSSVTTNTSSTTSDATGSTSDTTSSATSYTSSTTRGATSNTRSITSSTTNA